LSPSNRDLIVNRLSTPQFDDLSMNFQSGDLLPE
jgi:hypothetical protein